VQGAEPFIELRKDCAFERASWVGSESFISTELHEEHETGPSYSDIFLVGDWDQMYTLSIEDYESNQLLVPLFARSNCEYIDTHPSE
jgi:hypothetical protein